MKLFQGFRLARALSELSADFERRSSLPGFSERELEGISSLSIYGPMQVRKWKSRLAGYDRQSITRALLRHIHRANRRGDLQAHRALIAMWRALAAEDVATSERDWMRLEFGLEPAEKSTWVVVRHPY